MTHYTPSHDNVFFTRGTTDKTTSGIIMTSTTSEWIATIQAVGPGRLLPDGSLSPTGFHEGQKVIIFPGCGIALDLPGLPSPLWTIKSSEIQGWAD